jgi:sugar phosphate isomerase/epimerase
MSISRRSFMKHAAYAGVGISLTPWMDASAVGMPAKFLNDIGVCTSIDNHALMESVGCHYVEETVGRFLVPEKSDAEFNIQFAKLKESKIAVESVNSFIPAKLKTVGPDVNEEALFTFVETAFRRMKQSNIKLVVLGSSGSRNIPEGFDRAVARQQFLSNAKKFADLAAKYQITIVIEPLQRSESNFINTVQEGLDLVREVNHPQLCLMADLFHMLRNGENGDAIVNAGKLLRHTHIAEKEKRSPPGVMGDDFTPYFAALKKINYKGRISVEGTWTDMKTELPKAIETIRAQAASV